jgi:hypothetical protein
MPEPLRPWHRWARNEDVNFDLKNRPDHCIVCGIVRYPLASRWAEEIASGPCPERKL